MRDLPRSVVYKDLGVLRERLLKGERIKNKGRYLLTLMNLEAKTRHLSRALKESGSVSVQAIVLSSPD
jgi:hypothetical protein